MKQDGPLHQKDMGLRETKLIPEIWLSNACKISKTKILNALVILIIKIVNV